MRLYRPLFEWSYWDSALTQYMQVTELQLNTALNIHFKKIAGCTIVDHPRLRPLLRSLECFSRVVELWDIVTA